MSGKLQRDKSAASMSFMDGPGNSTSSASKPAMERQPLPPLTPALMSLFDPDYGQPIKLAPRRCVQWETMPAKTLKAGGIRRVGEKRNPQLNPIFGQATNGPGILWPLYIWGATGTGKTCGSLTMLDWSGGIYVTLSQLHRRINQAQHKELYNARGYLEDSEDVWQQWFSATLCVLDEVGRKAPTDLEVETLQTALDRRIARPLVVLSNCSPADIGRVYGDPIRSRISCGTVLGPLSGDMRRRRRHDANSAK